VTITPRTWQPEALSAIYASLKRGDPALLSACTGAGKSIFLALLLISVLETLRPGWVIVVTVPTEALVEQLYATLREHLGPVVARWYGRKKETGRVYVCCLPSLASLVDELAAIRQRCGLWVGDEVHRAEAYTETIERLAPARRLGVTATPYRSSTGLTLWPEVTYRYTMERAIGEGVLVPPRIVGWEGDRRTDVIDSLLTMLPGVAGLPGVVGAASIDEATALAERLPLRCSPISSRTPKAERVALIERLRVAELDALVHVRLLAEGVDLPWLIWLALTTRHSRTRLQLVQEVGRVLRCHPGKTEGIVLDPLGLCYSVGLVHPADLVAAADEPEPTEKLERDPLDKIPPDKRPIYAVPLDAVQAWLLRESWQRLRRDRVVAPGEATEGQIRAIEDARRKLRWLSGDTRTVVERLMDVRPISREVAGVILDTLHAASRAAAEHKAQTGEWARAPRMDWGRFDA
jgi:superfamily II DNA or RNA helicase